MSDPTLSEDQQRAFDNLPLYSDPHVAESLDIRRCAAGFAVWRGWPDEWSRPDQAGKIVSCYATALPKMGY